MNRKKSSLKLLSAHWSFPVLVLILVNLCLGALIFWDYGESWDELDNRLYGENSLEAFTWWWDKDVDLEDSLGTDQRYRGPAYAMIATLLVSALQELNSGWFSIDLWHLVNFFTFQLGVFFFYLLCVRYIGRWAAIGSTFLLATQPLLWGHAFINSKDIPFMVFFLGSVSLGLRMVDTFLSISDDLPDSYIKQGGDLRYNQYGHLLLAGIFLGLCMSTRALGVASGLLVALFFLVKARLKAIPILAIYFIIAVGVAYLSWPFLWPKPWENFLESLSVSSDFAWKGSVLFQGKNYKGNVLPRRYFPVLLMLQFTEPIYLLSIFGGMLALVRGIKKELAWDVILLNATWFWVPVTLVLLFKPLMYDNFRHFLFILPPIFFFSGVALDALFRRVRSSIVNAIILVALLTPGLYWGIYLHPYQYIYYNSFNGGVGAAFREYELDYWATSYREATLFLNQHAPYGSNVLVTGPQDIFIDYAREDMKKEYTEDDLATTTGPVYLISMTRYSKDKTTFPDAEIIYEVERDGALLAVVKRIR